MRIRIDPKRSSTNSTPKKAMSDSEKVNPQITDAVTQTNVSVVAAAPAQSMGVVYQNLAHALGISMQNAVIAQSSMQQIGTSVVGTVCAKIIEAGGMSPESSDTQAGNSGSNVPQETSP